MPAEKIIEQILSKNPKVSKIELLERLQRERRKTGGLISDDALLRVIAAEFGVEIPRNEALALFLAIKDLIPGLNNIAVVGRVLAVFSPKSFKGNRSGKFASLLVADQSGLLRVVLWNDKTRLMESGGVKVGQVVRFSHGYTREDQSGKVELHIGEKGEVEIDPKGVRAEDYPTISRFSTKIREITQTYRNKKVNVMGAVKELLSASTFMRQDSSSGKVMRFTLVDETGEVAVVVWNEKVDELDKVLKKGVRLQVVSARVKKASDGGVEIHVDSGTYVGVSQPAEELMKIAELKEGVNHVAVEGEVVTKPMLRDVKTSKGDAVRLAVFELRDETGKIWVSAWGEKVGSVEGLRVGDSVIIKNGYVRRGFGDQLEVSTRAITSIVLLSKKRDVRSE
jgi:replication factor A1